MTDDELDKLRFETWTAINDMRGWPCRVIHINPQTVVELIDEIKRLRKWKFDARTETLTIRNDAPEIIVCRSCVARLLEGGK